MVFWLGLLLGQPKRYYNGGSRWSGVRALWDLGFRVSEVIGFRGLVRG